MEHRPKTCIKTYNDVIEFERTKRWKLQSELYIIISKKIKYISVAGVTFENKRPKVFLVFPSCY